MNVAFTQVILSYSAPSNPKTETRWLRAPLSDGPDIESTAVCFHSRFPGKDEVSIIVLYPVHKTRNILYLSVPNLSTTATPTNVLVVFLSPSIHFLNISFKQLPIIPTFY
jgi:hypothetical protein